MEARDSFGKHEPLLDALPHIDHSPELRPAAYGPHVTANEVIGAAGDIAAEADARTAAETAWEQADALMALHPNIEVQRSDVGDLRVIERDATGDTPFVPKRTLETWLNWPRDASSPNLMVDVFKTLPANDATGSCLPDARLTVQVAGGTFELEQRMGDPIDREEIVTMLQQGLEILTAYLGLSPEARSKVWGSKCFDKVRSQAELTELFEAAGVGHVLNFYHNGSATPQETFVFLSGVLPRLTVNGESVG